MFKLFRGDVFSRLQKRLFCGRLCCRYFFARTTPLLQNYIYQFATLVPMSFVPSGIVLKSEIMNNYKT
jgi:hypothetical protein